MTPARPGLAWALAALAIVWLLAYWRFIIPAAPYRFHSVLGGDAFAYHYPCAVFIAESFKSGMSPLWNPWQQAGFPFLADPQTQLWSLPLWLATHLSTFRWESFQLLCITTFWFAGLNGYLLGRALGLSWGASLFSGIAWMTSGIFVGHGGHAGLSWGYALFPAALACLYCGSLRPLARVTLAGSAWGLACLGTHPSLALTGTFAFGVFIVTRAAREGRCSSLRGWLAVAVSLLVLVVSAALTYSIQWVPVAMYGPELNRGALPFETAVEAHSFLPRYLLTLLLPALGSTLQGPIDPTMRNAYIGLMPLLLLPAAMSLRKQRFWTGDFVVVGLLNLLAAMGPSTAIRPILAAFAPFFDFFQYPSANFRGFFMLAVIMISAQGFDAIIHIRDNPFKPLKKARLRSGYLLASVIGGIALPLTAFDALLLSRMNDTNGHLDHFVMQCLFLMTGATVLRCANSSGLWQLVMLAAHALDTSANATRNSWTIGPRADAATEAAIERIERARVAARTAPLNLRREINFSIDPQTVNIHFVERRGSLFVYNPGHLKSIFSFLEKSERFDVFSGETIPRACIMEGAPQNFMEPAAVPTAETLVAGGGAVSIVEYGNTLVRLRLNAPLETAKTLILFDAYARGWKARVGGAPADIHPAFGAFRAIHAGPSPSGTEIVFSFEPIAMRIGAALTLAGIFLAGLVAAVEGRQFLKRQQNVPLH